MINIASRLQEVRFMFDLSQADVAELMGITSRTYQNYEYGRTKMDCEGIYKLCEKLNISLDYFFGRTDDMHSHQHTATPQGKRHDESDIKGFIGDVDSFMADFRTWRKAQEAQMAEIGRSTGLLKKRLDGLEKQVKKEK